MLHPMPVALVEVEFLPVFVEFIKVGCILVPFGILFRKVFDTLLSQYTHVNLESQQRKNTQGEYSQNNDIAQILDGFNHGTDNRFEA